MCEISACEKLNQTLDNLLGPRLKCLPSLTLRSRLNNVRGANCVRFNIFWRLSLTADWQLMTADEFFFENMDEKFHPWKVNICNFVELGWSEVCLVKHCLEWAFSLVELLSLVES